MDEILEEAADLLDGPDKTVCPAWEVALASVVGGFFLWLADVVFNGQQAVTNKMAHFLGNQLSSQFDSQWAEGLALLVLIALGWALCFVYRPKTRPGAFTRGSSVIAVLVGMNTGSMAVAGAEAETIAVQGSAMVTYETPRAQGPFGLGSVITGKAASPVWPLEVPGQATVACADVQEIASERYCGVDRATAGTLGVELPAGRDRLWIRY